MKKLLTLCISCIILGSVQAQSITEKYLKMIPSLPKDTCNITHAGIDNFQKQVTALSDQLRSEIESLGKIAANKMEGSEEIAKANAMQQMSQQYGLTPEQMQKMKSGKMSAADKQALANQVLQQQTNMSMGEVKNLSKMSDAGKKAYAEAYATEMMATGQTGQNQQNIANAKNLNQLMAEQQTMMSKISATGKMISNLYTTIENDPELQKSYADIEKWHSKLMSMSGVDAGQGKQMDSLGVLITKEQIKICSTYTPRYRAALNQHLSLTKSLIPDTYQLGQITAQLTKLQTGVEQPAESTEVGNLQLITGYLESLKDAYKFKLSFPEEN